MKLRVFAITVVMAIGCFASVGAAGASANCQKVKASEYSYFTGPTSVEGIVTRGGILNGRSIAVLTSDFFPTPDSTTFAFTIEKSFITERGTIQTQSPHILDLATGVGTAFARIDPESSTGYFAGATGTLFINFKQVDGGAAAIADISGEICYAD